jgi:hypothetical protein
MKNIPAFADGVLPLGDSVDSVRTSALTIVKVSEIGGRKAADPEVKAFFASIAPFHAALSAEAADLMKLKKPRRHSN